jgi:hypothetical protein
MSFETLRKAVEDQFIANWTGTALSNVDHGDNQDFDPPITDKWVRLITNVISNENAEVGANFQRAIGIITVQCFAPVNNGERDLLLFVDEVSSIFQNKKFGGVSCFTTMPVRLGDTGNWYQINAKTDFQYDVFS